MKHFAYALALLALVACGKKEATTENTTENTTEAIDNNKPENNPNTEVLAAAPTKALTPDAAKRFKTISNFEKYASKFPALNEGMEFSSFSTSSVFEGKKFKAFDKEDLKTYGVSKDIASDSEQFGFRIGQFDMGDQVMLVHCFGIKTQGEFSFVVYEKASGKPVDSFSVEFGNAGMGDPNSAEVGCRVIGAGEVSVATMDLDKASDQSSNMELKVVKLHDNGFLSAQKPS